MKRVSTWNPAGVNQVGTNLPVSRFMKASHASFEPVIIAGSIIAGGTLWLNGTRSSIRNKQPGTNIRERGTGIVNLSKAFCRKVVPADTWHLRAYGSLGERQNHHTGGVTPAGIADRSSVC